MISLVEFYKWILRVFEFIHNLKLEIYVDCVQFTKHKILAVFWEFQFGLQNEISWMGSPNFRVTTEQVKSHIHVLFYKRWDYEIKPFGALSGHLNGINENILDQHY